MRTSGVEVRLERARERCDSNGPQGESRSGELSSITDHIRKACSTSRLFFSVVLTDMQHRFRKSSRTAHRSRGRRKAPCLGYGFSVVCGPVAQTDA